MPIEETFRKDRKHWSHDQSSEVELFFTLSPFFGSFYQHEDFHTVVDLAFYHKLQPNQEVELSLNKKSSAVILLSGHIEYYRLSHGHHPYGKDKKHKSEKDISSPKYVKIGECLTHPELIEIKTDVLIKSPEKVSEFLFVPTILFDSYVSKVKQRRIQTILAVLIQVFREVPKRELKEMAESDCQFREIRMNNCLYRAGEKAEYVYVVVQGSVKLDSPGYELKKMAQAIIGQNTLFGHNDPKDTERTQNAVCCSAKAKILQIPYESLSRLLLHNKTLNIVFASTIKDIDFSRGKRSQSERVTLPRLHRFHSFVKPEEEERIEKQLVQNCHMLVNLSPRRKGSSGFRLPEQLEKDYSVNQFQQKLKLFKKRGSPDSQLDLSNKLF